MNATMLDSPGTIEDVLEHGVRPLDQNVSVIVPAFNEATHIVEQIRAVRAVMEMSGWNFEIIVVDDGSTDGTAENAALTGARTLRHRRNRGYGAALKSGIREARFDWILITDADGTYPASAMPALLKLAGESDMVVGARTGKSVKIPFVRRPAKWFLGRLASYLVGRNLPDLNSGLRLMRRELIERYEHLLPAGFSFTTTITMAATCNDHRVNYVPINYSARLGTSKIRSRHGFDFLLVILRTMVFFNPLKVFLPLGAVLGFAGIAKFAYDIGRQNLSESAIFGMLAALVIWAVGLLADQNARIAFQRK